MPVTLTYGLAVIPSSSGPGFVVPVFPAAGAGLTCDQEAFGQQHFLDLYDRIFPLEWINPLKINANAGYELLQAFAKIGERISLAVNRFECGLFIIYATGGTASEISLSFSRPSAAAGAVTILAGTRFSTSQNGRQFVLVEDVVFGGADLGPIAGIVRAVAVGYEFNVPGQVITTGSAITLPGDIDTIDAWVLDPAYGDTTLEFEQIAFPVVEGKCADLDALGANRGRVRVTGEIDGQYRLRIQSFPDVVSPAAMRRAVERKLAPARVPIPYDFCETFEHRYQEVYDAPSPNAGTPSYDGGIPPTNPDYDNTTFVYDDPRPVTTVFDFCRNRTMDEIEYRGAFVVVVPNNITLVDVGMAFDDPGTGPSDFLDSSTGVRRGTPAFDVPSGADDNITIMTACYDGFDFERAPLYAALNDELQAVKPAGVAAIIETIRD